MAIFLSSIMFWMKKAGMEDDFNGTKPYVIAKDDKNKDVVMVTTENNGALENIIESIINMPDDIVKKATVNAVIEPHLLTRSDKNIGNAFKFFLNTISDKYEEEKKDNQN